MTAALPADSAVGSASIWVLGQVAGRRRSARVLHAGPDAVYLDLEGSCFGILAARSVQVPCGVRTTLPSLPRVTPGAEATIDGGAIILPGLQVLVADIVDTTVPVLPPEVAARGATQLTGLAAGRTERARDLLPAGAIDALCRADAAAVPALLGLGPGLTPLGDDVLAGWLATAVAARHPGLPDVRRAVALTAGERTTTLSATLLACAARGEVVPELRSLLAGVAADDPALVERSMASLLDVGDTSGAGVLLGTLCALESLTMLVGTAG